MIKELKRGLIRSLIGNSQTLNYGGYIFKKKRVEGGVELRIGWEYDLFCEVFVGDKENYIVYYMNNLLYRDQNKTILHTLKKELGYRNSYEEQNNLE